ncbi:MAG: histidine kinase [Firmicutes bacterium]|nr:histidine kinase [Bacillota bacterium]
MFDPTLDLGRLDAIIKETITAIEESKEQIYAIAEGAREEYRRLKAKMVQIQGEAAAVIAKVDKLQRLEQRARRRLMEISKGFDRYTEEDIRLAYDAAKDTQVELALYREREKLLRQQRDDLERNLRNLGQTVQRAEGLVSQVGVVMDYLGGGLRGFSQILEGVQQREQLAVGIIKAQEDERGRVAREIHDGPAQSLTNLVFRVELCEKLLLNKSLGELQGELAELKGLIKESIREVRKIIFALRPMALDDLGLIPALRRYLEGLEEKDNLWVDLVPLGNEIRLPANVEIGAFRIIQEALHNVAKHARVSRAKVTISYGRKQLLISVRDEGIGFDPGKVADRSSGGEHYGLISMRERAELLGGGIEIKSGPGKGTRVIIAIPITEREEGWPLETNSHSIG